MLYKDLDKEVDTTNFVFLSLNDKNIEIGKTKKVFPNQDISLLGYPPIYVTFN